MKHTTLIVAALPALFLGIAQAKGGTIIGPSSLGIVGGNDTSWGIQFTALQNSVLESFDYYQKPTTGSSPFFGTISLNDITTPSTVYSTTYSVGSPTVVSITGLTLLLQSAHNYQLVATSNIVSGGSDEVYQYDSLDSPPFTFPVSDSEISVTNGVFSLNPGFQTSHGWAAFKNITTAAAVPEPASLILLGIGIAGVAVYARTRRKPLSA